MTNFRYARSYHGPLQAVIFDWAGTVIDHGSRAPAIAFVEVFRRHEVEISINEAREPMGQSKRDHIVSICRIPAVADRWQEVHGRATTEADVDAMYAEFLPLQIDCLAAHAELISGTTETVAWLRERGIRVGGTTGYVREIMDVLEPIAARSGFAPDASVCASDVPRGRPAPWMALECAKRLNAYPMEAVVKIDDTIPGIEEGLNAGAWAVGVAETGNELGLSEEELGRLPENEHAESLRRATQRLAKAGSHYVVRGVGDLIPCIEDIQRRVARGERP
ncbi:MAG TPA: phosphonoacetaldehyde hydrolase [Planctomycetaceae bacterium]|nr:phosphonoacetaldehyde hydrolase [Planctomycetaceae bacterium]